MAQLKGGAEIRDYQQNSITLDRPTKEFTYRAVIPKVLGVNPLSPIVTRHDPVFADEQKYLLEEAGVYRVSEEDIDGTDCWVMEIHRFNPPYKASYKLRWALPNRAAIPGL